VRRELGDRWGVARTYNNLGIVFHDIGNYDQAERYFQECLALRQELGDRRGTAVALNNLG
jgi:tetratricopeptide (TPR) repeat protein